MPYKPAKKQRPWIPRRKAKPYVGINTSRSSEEMKYFYNSKSWRSLRNYKIQINPLCEMCESKGLIEPGKEIDHIEPLKDNPNKKLSLHNLQTLCRSCHSKKSVEDRERRKHIKKYY